MRVSNNPSRWLIQSCLSVGSMICQSIERPSIDLNFFTSSSFCSRVRQSPISWQCIVAFCPCLAGFLTRIVIEIGVREPLPNILPPSLRESSPLVRWLPRRLRTYMSVNSFSRHARKPSEAFPSSQEWRSSCSALHQMPALRLSETVYCFTVVSPTVA